MKNTNLSCQTYKNWVVLVLDNELPEDRRTILNSHVNSCPECQQYKLLLTNQDIVLNKLPRVTPAAEFTETVWDKIRTTIPIQGTNKAWRNWVTYPLRLLQPYPVIAVSLSLIIFSVALNFFSYYINSSTEVQLIKHILSLTQETEPLLTVYSGIINKI